ncbi:MAG: hypothetical protein EA406_13305 [Rhodospirillales bacterium]|nr:MAG: hypothetical protein EA406_13305 [Rhodospirillales bacterium]
MLLDIAEFSRRRLHFFSERLPWQERIAPSIYRLKDGAFLRLFAFTGRDPIGMDDRSFEAMYENLNGQLRRYEGGYAFWIEAQRRRVMPPPPDSFPNAAARLFEEERLAPFHAGERFETRRYLSVVWFPPSQTETLAERALSIDGEGEALRGYQYHLERFGRETDALADVLRGTMAGIEPLSAREGDTYLHSCVSDVDQNVCLADPRCIDKQICDADFVGGKKPRLGATHLRVVGIRGWPEGTCAGMLALLDALPIEYRYVVRWLSMSHGESKASIMRNWSGSALRRTSLMGYLVQILTKKDPENHDPEAVYDTSEAMEAIRDKSGTGIVHGLSSINVVTWHQDPLIADEAAKEIERLLRSRDFVAREEDYHAAEAYLGTLPGHSYANVARWLTASRNFAHLAPVTSVWTGADEVPPLALAATPGRDPFRLSLRSGGVNHALVLGETGGGKSVLLGTLAMQWQRYPGARVILLDKGRSARIATLCCGGQYVDVGAGGMAFQPLADVDRPAGRRSAHAWLSELCEDQGVAVDQTTSRALERALDLVAASPRHERTLTVLQGFLPVGPAKEALRPFVAGGRFGGLLDAPATPDFSSRWITLEMSELMEPDMRMALVPVLTHLFRLIEDTLDGSPTLLVLDECWRFILDKAFAPRLAQWLKELRKRNTGVVLATQSLADLAQSPLAPVILDSCKTRLFTPNPRAHEQEQAKHWAAIGITAEQRAVIAAARLADEYIIDQGGNFGVFSFHLRQVGLALVGSASNTDHALADRIIASHGPHDFLRGWLQAKGLGLSAASLPEPVKEEYCYAAAE